MHFISFTTSQSNFLATLAEPTKTCSDLEFRSWSNSGPQACFASLSFGNQAMGWRPLFTLARAHKGSKTADDDLWLELLDAAMRQKGAQQQDEQPTGRGRGGRTDDWFEERRIACCACRRLLRATAAVGVECQGCHRWFHDACCPASSAASGAGHDKFFHSPECRQIHEWLVKTSASHLSDSLQLPGERSLVLLDLRRLRTRRSVQLRDHDFGGLDDAADQQQGDRAEALATGGGTQDSGTDPAGTAAGGPTASTSSRSPPLASISRHDPFRLRARGQKSLGIAAAPPASPSPVQAGEAQLVEGVGGVAAGRASRSVKLRTGDDGMHMLQLAAGVLREHYDQSLQELMEDDYVALLRHHGQPVCAASLLVFGQDHARIQALATTRPARRLGHAGSLTAGLSALLGAAGVNSLALMVPDDDGDGSEEQRVAAAARRRLGFRQLQDLGVLAEWKRAFSSYHRDLMAGLDVWVKPLVISP